MGRLRLFEDDGLRFRVGVESCRLTDLLRDSRRDPDELFFLEEEFVRGSSRVAKEICETAGLDPDTKPKSIVLEQAKAPHERSEERRVGEEGRYRWAPHH